jgi:hypothetical protein
MPRGGTGHEARGPPVGTTRSQTGAPAPIANGCGGCLRTIPIDTNATTTSKGVLIIDITFSDLDHGAEGKGCMRIPNSQHSVPHESLLGPRNELTNRPTPPTIKTRMVINS